MEQSAQQSQPVRGVAAYAAQTAYTAPYQSAGQTAYTAPYQSAAQTAYTAPYQSGAMVTGAPALPGAMPPGIQLTPTFPTNPHQLAYQQIQQLHQQQQHQQQHQQLQAFWAAQMANIEQTTDFKNHSLPLSRIKKVMKADEDVKMISAETPVIFAKACELFIMELTLRSWNHAEENKRRTLQKSDISAAVNQTDIYDFLVDVIPRDGSKGESSGSASAALPAIGAQADPMAYYYVPPPDQVTGAEMIMGKPADQTSTAPM